MSLGENVTPALANRAASVASIAAPSRLSVALIVLVP